ncbi:tetratricopeptide repeat protein [Thiorhodovibrio frisius]|uniref:Cytochrome c biogenesis factor n=1 Tax=Thiorhodovibrio frisius TaxID=631362 RepID=H8YWY9_9GAMM|nr:ATP-binding protein [Thiorhodovibrio frisius]EIC22965.1 cytochrome c biogenesis factor [Thiorhodovibrio frisius]WPL22774.1 putative PEP-CTERM system TPR-repeat lipoprotein [Thiorhodovibrio frisius]
MDNRLQLTPNHPWPGLLAYREAEAGYFHGREAESRQLLQRVKRQSVTILFGQSGLGKTSLLQAGLFPPLRQQGHLPIYCRLDHHPQSPPLAQQLLQQIQSQAHQAGIDAPNLTDNNSLWHGLYHRDHEFWDNRNRLLTPVIVLDQFEECFTLGRQTPSQQQRTDEFLQQLASLIEKRLPGDIEQQLADNPDQAETYDFQRGAIPILISLREDFLADFEGLRQTMPALAHNRMRLERMKGDAARQVLQQPAQQLLDATTAEQIVYFVAGERQQSLALEQLEIEPALLSVIASELNQRRIEAGQTQITPHLLKQNQSEILNDFYQRSLVDLPEAVAPFIEEQLLTEGGYRNSFALEDAMLLPGIERQSIDTLVSRRLLRLEERYGSLRVELTHDVLTGIVKGYRDRRRATEERSRQRRRNRIFAGVTTVLLLVVATFGGIAWYALLQQQLAEQQRQIADEQRLEAEKQKMYAENNKNESDKRYQLFKSGLSSFFSFLLEKDMTSEYTAWIASKDRVKELDSIIKELIQNTESMDNDERRYWLDILDSMTDAQRARLMEILAKEVAKLDDLERRYMPKIIDLHIKHMNEMLQIDPNNETVWYKLGQFWLRTKKPERISEAKKAFLTQVDVNPQHDDAWYVLYQIYMSDNELTKAEDALRNQVKVTPNHKQAWGALGSLLQNANNGGNYDEIATYYQKHLDINPLDTTILANDMELALIQRDLKRATLRYNTVLSLLNSADQESAILPFYKWLMKPNESWDCVVNAINNLDSDIEFSWNFETSEPILEGLPPQHMQVARLFIRFFSNEITIDVLKGKLKKLKGPVRPGKAACSSG